MHSTKTALITGATSGIGTVIAEHLARKGYNLVVLGRSTQKLDALTDHLTSINEGVILDTILCDLSSFNSIRKACDQIKASHESIDTLMLNAGLWNFRFIQTTDKIEETLQVNLLAPIAIFNELKALIPNKQEAKVIFTSSGLHQGIINFSDMEFRAKFSGFKAYRQSKLGLIMLTRWLSKQPVNSGIGFYCVHPGMVNTQLGRSAGWLSRSIFKLFGKSKEKGAQTHIHLIDSVCKELQTGEYYANSKVTKTTSYSYNMEDAEKLWDAVQKYIINE
jgi:NAD(P)-dependent dehydrogenase (short-subunit alcohol dehydrogenase family)